MKTVSAVTALASAARTVSGVVDLGTLPGESSELLLYLNVTAISGIGSTMTITYQSSHDGVTFFDNTIGPAVIAIGKTLIKIPSTTGNHGRLSYAIAGTAPSVTFSVVAETKRI